MPGLTVARIALGCGNFGGVGSAPEFFGQGLTEDQALELMDAAWAAGIEHFDTADAYGGGRSEQAIGRWIRSRGVRPRLTTKTFNPMQAGADHGLAARTGSPVSSARAWTGWASTGSTCTWPTTTTRPCRSPKPSGPSARPRPTA